MSSSTTHTHSFKFCPYCGVKIELPGAKFCAECGGGLGEGGVARSAGEATGSTRNTKIVAGSAVVFAAGVWLLLPGLLGKQPDAGSVASAPPLPKHAQSDQEFNGTSVSVDPDLQKLLDQKPLPLTEIRKYARTLQAKIATKEPSQVELLSVLEALQTLVKEDPKDTESLLLLADFAFNQRVFKNAAMYYQQYLDKKPDDVETRAQLGSALTFLGKFDEASKELDEVIKTHPKYFQAKAFKAILLAQNGKVEDAKAIGEEALKVAPSKEAKERFGEFLKSLDKAATEGDRGNIQSESAPTSGESLTTDERSSVTAFIKAHPVVGPKVTGIETKGDEILVTLKEFPMDKMPPFVKDSLQKKIKESLSHEGNAKSVSLIDEGTKSVMMKIEK